MSFQHKNFWTPRDSVRLTDAEIGYDNSSRSEPKRSHQWVMDATGTELFSNKKQAIEAVNRPVLGISRAIVSQWNSSSSFQPLSGQFSDRLFGSEPVRTVNLVDQNIPSGDSGNPNMGRKGFQDQYSNSSMGLSTSHYIEDPSCFYRNGGRKVKVNQVRESGIGLSASMGEGSSSMSMGPNGINSNEDTITMCHNFNKSDRNFISMGHTLNKGDENCIPMRYNYGRRNDNVSLVDQSFKGNGNNYMSIVQSYEKGDTNTIPFGGYQDESETNPSGNIISSYDLLVGTQNSVEAPEEPSQPNLVEPNVDSTVNSTQITNPIAETTVHREATAAKKVSANNFPSNVKSLLSTGMFDGVPVKYVSWSREKNLKGFINGTGYQCGCDNCNYTKTLNAYEFERHANCKTKHPNNHIYFQNGKTVYAVVQELKKTPQEMLFDAIQNVTGSQINQKNFRIWKASYQAATRELQRIYGKDDIVVPS